MVNSSWCLVHCRRFYGPGSVCLLYATVAWLFFCMLRSVVVLTSRVRRGTNASSGRSMSHGRQSVCRRRRHRQRHVVASAASKQRAKSWISIISASLNPTMSVRAISAPSPPSHSFRAFSPVGPLYGSAIRHRSEPLLVRFSRLRSWDQTQWRLKVDCFFYRRFCLSVTYFSALSVMLPMSYAV